MKEHFLFQWNTVGVAQSGSGLCSTFTDNSDVNSTPVEQITPLRGVSLHRQISSDRRKLPHNMYHQGR